MTTLEICSEQSKKNCVAKFVLHVIFVKYTTHFGIGFRARKCESAFDTFYKPQEKCLPIADQSGGPCPTNQLLYDIDGINEGVCDCNTNLEFVFHEQTESCYQLNTEVTIFATLDLLFRNM